MEVEIKDSYSFQKYIDATEKVYESICRVDYDCISHTNYMRKREILSSECYYYFSRCLSEVERDWNLLWRIGSFDKTNCTLRLDASESLLLSEIIITSKYIDADIPGFEKSIKEKLAAFDVQAMNQKPKKRFWFF